MNTQSLYAFFANVMVTLHFIYVMFVLTGELAIIAGWIFKQKWIRNIPFRVTHLVAIMIVAAQALLKVPCPLTVWENQLREKAGQTAEWDISFIGRLLRAVIYYDFPDWVFMLIYVGFAALVLLTVILIPPRKKAKR